MESENKGLGGRIFDNVKMILHIIGFDTKNNEILFSLLLFYMNFCALIENGFGHQTYVSYVSYYFEE
jgi:hypothetical protein